jgi:hypothetical protein
MNRVLISACALALIAAGSARSEQPAATGDASTAINVRTATEAVAACNASPDRDDCKQFKAQLMQFLGVPAPAPLAAQPQPQSQPIVVRQDIVRNVTDAQAAFTATVAKTTGEQRTPLASTQANTVANGHGEGPAGQLNPNPGDTLPSFTASSDTKTASVVLAYGLQPMQGWQDTWHSLSVTVQTPFGQGQDYQNTATLDGFTKATSISLKYSLIHVDQKEVISHSKVSNSDDYQATCNKYLDQIIAVDPDVAKRTQAGAKLYSILRQKDSCLADLASNLLAMANNNNFRPAELSALNSALSDLENYTQPLIRSLWLGSVNAKVGYESHNFFTSPSLLKGSEEKTPVAVGASLTRVFDFGHLSITGAYNYQDVYQDGGAGGQMHVLCPPTGSPVLKCVNGYIGAPTAAYKSLITGEVRYITKDLFSRPFGIDPTVTYDANSRAYGVEVPIYVIADTSKTLTGGVRYDWTSAKHESVVGIFVASAFCIVPGSNACQKKAPSADASQ